MGNNLSNRRWLKLLFPKVGGHAPYCDLSLSHNMGTRIKPMSGQPPSRFYLVKTGCNLDPTSLVLYDQPRVTWECTKTRGTKYGPKTMESLMSYEDPKKEPPCIETPTFVATHSQCQMR